MTEVNGTWEQLLATNAAGTETGPKAYGRRGRLQLRLDGAIEGINAHLDRCATCLVHGNALCDEGTFSRDEVELARSTVLRYELRHLPAPTVATRLGRFALRTGSA
jgi:selenocysteine lyase/cysteine desulfurase